LSERGPDDTPLSSAEVAHVLSCILFSNVSLLRCLYMHRGTYNSCSAYSTTLKTVHYFKGLCIRGIIYV